MVEEYSERWKKYGRFLCISDHGMMGAVPRQISACEKVCDELKDKNAFSPIFAVELYVNRFHTEATTTAAERAKFISTLSDVEKKQFQVRGSHLLAIAYNSTGYTNLIRLTTWAYLNGFYGKPRVNYEQLLKHKEGILFTSCCYNSEIGRAFEYSGETWEEKRDAAAEVVERYMAMFGDKFYLEIMMLDFVKQKPYDRFIIWAADKYKLPIILTNDCHYCLPEDSEFQRLMLMQQTGKTVLDIQKSLNEEGIKDLFELQDKQLSQKSEEELNDFYKANYSDVIDLDIFQEAKMNTVKICEMCKGVKLDRRNKLPKLPDAELRLAEYVERGFKERHLGGVVYKRRAAVEYELICRKGFASYFIIQKKMVDEARRYYREDLKLGSGYEAVGPGRGCLHGDSYVVIGTSEKKISDVCVGDVVWGKDGIARSVKKIWQYPCNETLLKINVFYGDDAGLTVTHDHEVLTVKGVRPKNWDNWSISTKSSRRAWEKPSEELSWRKAADILPGDWVFFPRPKMIQAEIQPIDLADFVSSIDMECDEKHAYETWLTPTRNGVKRKRKCSRIISPDAMFFKILGYFAGDGWLCADIRPQVGFAFHNETDREWMFEVVEYFTDMGCHVRVTPHATKKVTQVLVYNRFIYNLFYSLHPRYKSTSQTKHIPDHVFMLSEELRRAYLSGYFQADGSGKFYKKTFSSASFELASGVRMLLRMDNMPAGITKYKRLDKRSGKVSIGWVVTSPISSEAMRYVWHQRTDGVLCQVKSIDVGVKTAMVYDLMVEENHPHYLTANGVVHNSAVGALTCYLLGITDVDPVEEDLLFDRFLSDSRGGRQIKLRYSNMDPILPIEGAG